MSMSDADDIGLEEALGAALDEGKPQPAEQEAIEGETPEQTQERLYRRDGRRFAAVEDDKDKAKPEAGKEQAQQAKPAWKPTWYKDEYGPWDKLGENFRNALREQERNASQAIEKHSTAAKAWEPVTQLLAPHRQELAAAGVSEQQYVSNLIEADKYLRTEPVQAINWLVSQYCGQGWDIVSLADWMAQNGHQPQKVDPLQQELAQLKQEITSLKSMPQQQARAAAEKQIADWAADKPDFAAVRPYMAAIAKQNPEASLDQLYEQARFAHPETRDRILQEREDKRLAELKGKRAAGAQSPRGGQTNGGQRNQKPTMSLEDEIAMHLDGGV